jgi:hypothetical protein
MSFRRARTISLAFALVLLPSPASRPKPWPVLATIALANHANDEPSSAVLVSVQASLVKGFRPCDSPNDSTNAIPGQACSPAVANDDVCEGFLRGSGKMAVKLTRSGDLQISASAKQLAFGCEGETLCAVVSVRATTDDCGSPGHGACTTEDRDLQGPCCTVTNGQCVIPSSTLRRVVGKSSRTAVDVRGCGLTRTSIRHRCVGGSRDGEPCEGSVCTNDELGGALLGPCEQDADCIRHCFETTVPCETGADCSGLFCIPPGRCDFSNGCFGGTCDLSTPTLPAGPTFTCGVLVP